MSRLTRSVLLALALGLATGAAAPMAQAAADCPKKIKGELVRSGGGVTWTKGGSLYVCTAYYGDPPVSKKLGPWTKGSQLAFTGSTVVWTARKKQADGVSDDLIYAADGPFGTWLKGVRLTTGPTSKLDNRVSRMAAYGDAVAWVTTKGTVMMAVAQPRGETATSVGEGTPGAAAPVVSGVTDVPAVDAGSVLAYPQGLSTPPKATGRRLLVGRWTALAGGEFSDTLQLGEGAEGDGDECGGINGYEVTVQPVAGQPRVGARWMSDWTSTSKACTG